MSLVHAHFTILLRLAVKRKNVTGQKNTCLQYISRRV